MASQSLNHSDESVPADHAAVEDHNHGRYPNHQVAATEYREINVDELSESDFAEMRDSGLAYGDHDYFGSNPNVKCPPETSKFPVMGGVTDQYLNGETTDPCVERTDNRLTGTATPIPAPGSVMRKPQLSGATVFRPVKGEDFAHTGSSQLPLLGKSVTFNVTQQKNVTQPKKPGRPPRNDPRELGNDRLIGRAMVKAGIQAQHAHHIQPNLHHMQNICGVQDVGLTPRGGAAPLVTPARGQRVMPRGRSAANPRRDVPEEGSGYPIMPSQQATPAFRSISPKKVTQFRSARAAEEAHTREMMEAAQNALAPSNVSMTGHSVLLGAHNQLHHPPIVLPVQHQQHVSHLDDDLPRTPGKGHSYTPMASPLPSGSRRTISESQETTMHMLHEPLRSNSDGLPVTPGGGRKAPGRSRTPRSRMSISESTASGSQADSPHRSFVVSPSSQQVIQPRPLHPSPQRLQTLHGGHLKSPIGPSTMVSAQMQMSSNAPMPSLHSQPYLQPPVVQRHVGPSSSGRAYYDIHGSQAAPLITASGSNTYTPRRRKEKETDEAVEAEVSRNVKNILQAEKTHHRLSTTSSHTLSPRNEASDDDNGEDGRMEESTRERHGSMSKRTNQKQSKQMVKEWSESGEEEESWEVSCICGQEEDDGEEMVECDMCKLRWEHVDCIFPRTKKVPEGSYFCHVCKPRPTELTREQARAYQDRVKEQKERQKEAELKRKLDERHKRRDENSRKAPSSLMRTTHSKGNASKLDKSAQYREIERNEYSPNAKRLLNMDRSGGGLVGDAEILKSLRKTPIVRSLIVEANILGLVALTGISSGSYVAELCGHVTLQKECPNRDLASGSLNDLTFLFEKDDVNIIIDARKCGNFARYLRRSCKPNSELQVIRSGSETHFMITTTKEVNHMDEISIEFENDWKKQPRPSQGCACRRSDDECEMKSHFNKKSKMEYAQKMPSSSRRSLPANGTTPKGARSPIRRALTEKKKGASAKKVITKKGKKKGTIKLPRHSRKTKGESGSTADESGGEGEGESEKEYEESTADEKDGEEMKEETQKSPRRGRRDTGSTIGSKEKEGDEEKIGGGAATRRSSTRIRNDSEVKKEEVEVTVKDEMNTIMENNQSESGGSKKRGRQSGVEKVEETQVKEEVKEEPECPLMKKVKKKKEWPTMDYTLPSERNKPSREDRKIQALMVSMEKNKSETRNRGSSSRGRPATAATPATPATPAGPPPLTSGRGKRKTEMEEEAARVDAVTAAASTPLLAPPRKRWAAAETKKEKESPAPSSLSSMPSPMREESVVPSAGKKKLLHRYQQGQKEREKTATAAEARKVTSSTSSTPTRSKRLNKKEEMGAVEALVNMGGVKSGGIREEMKREAIRLRDSLKPTLFSFENITRDKEESVPIGCSSSGDHSTVPLPIPPPPAPVATPIESAKTKKPSLSLEDYKKRKQTGGSGGLSGGMKKEEGERREEPPKKSFMPSVDASASVPTSLPHVNLPGLEETVGIDELQRRVYGETTMREGTSSSTPSMGKTQPTPKRLSINERLKNEFALPILSTTPLAVVTPIPPLAPPSAVAVSTAPSISPLSNGGQLTPTGGRTHKNRLSEARAMNVDPPGLMMQCPPPSSTPSRMPPSSSTTPSTSSTSFIQRPASIRNSK